MFCSECMNNLLVLLNLVITSIITIVIQIMIKQDKKKNFLEKQLFELQRLSFNYPFVEDKNYTNKWNKLKELYDKNELVGEELQNFLKYDSYTEMLFNYFEQSVDVYKNEKKLQEYVDFKSWIRIHGQNWNNPLEAHINHDVYSDTTCNIIDKWLK